MNRTTELKKESEKIEQDLSKTKDATAIYALNDIIYHKQAELKGRLDREKEILEIINNKIKEYETRYASQK